MSPLLLALATFSAQLALVVAAATLVESLGRLQDPRLRWLLWRGTALGCLALPLWAVFMPAPDAGAMTFLVATAGPQAFDATMIPAPASRVIGWLLGAGVLARLVWLCAGGIRLRQLRRRSHTAALTPDLDALRDDLAPGADLRVCAGIDQPAVFGLRRPIVLLPHRFFALEPHARCTVACHELLHVARRDWPWIVVEEIGRALFWFHPAVWWLVDRIQESREQLVDRLVLARFPAKQAYMRALLAFADGHRLPASATAFLRRRHLRSRLRMLGKESVMSRRRSTWMTIGLVSVMSTAIGATATALPLVWPGATTVVTQDVVEGKQPGVTMPRVLSEKKPRYTPEALQAKVEGTVLMSAVVRTDGIPDEIRITKSLDAEYGLDEQAMTALAQWRFEPGRRGGKPVAVRVTVEMFFTLRKDAEPR